MEICWLSFFLLLLETSIIASWDNQFHLLLFIFTFKKHFKEIVFVIIKLTVYFLFFLYIYERGELYFIHLFTLFTEPFSYSSLSPWLFTLAYHNETNKKTHIWRERLIKYVHIYHVEIKKITWKSIECKIVNCTPLKPRHGRRSQENFSMLLQRTCFNN